MARIRSVKPELRESKLVGSWPMEVRYFWVLFWGYLDDFGRGLDLPKRIAGDCFPLDRTETALVAMATRLRDWELTCVSDCLVRPRRRSKSRK